MPVMEAAFHWKDDSFSRNYEAGRAPRDILTHDDADLSVLHVELQFLCMDFIDAVESQARDGYLEKRASEATECLDLFPPPRW